MICCILRTCQSRGFYCISRGVFLGGADFAPHPSSPFALMMIPRVLGVVACGACAASAFTLPNVVPPTRHIDVSSRWATKAADQACGPITRTPVSMSAGGDDMQSSRREVIAGQWLIDGDGSASAVLVVPVLGSLLWWY